MPVNDFLQQLCQIMMNAKTLESLNEDVCNGAINLMIKVVLIQQKSQNYFRAKKFWVQLLKNGLENQLYVISEPAMGMTIASKSVKLFFKKLDSF